jgi:hypothetical protein
MKYNWETNYRNCDVYHICDSTAKRQLKINKPTKCHGNTVMIQPCTQKNYVEFKIK